MKVLITGFGSIGKRHYEVLSSIAEVSQIDLVTKQTVPSTKTYKDLSEINDWAQYDYFIISSETYKHYGQLKYISEQIKNKVILVEKPLFDKKYEFFELHNNKVFIAYNLRFHPVLNKLKVLLSSQTAYYVNVIAGQYLPTWRPEQDYRNSYSAQINQGGGVLRDLSHELDYVAWLFGDIIKIDSINAKISNLEINSDDLFTGIGVTDKRCVVNITMDYISKVPIRQLVVHCENETIFVDMVGSQIKISMDGKEDCVLEIAKSDRNYTYLQMHQAIINQDYDNLCNYDSGYKTVELIDNTDYKEL